MKLLAKASAIFDRVIDFLVFLACLLLMFAVVMVGLDVALRYFFGRPIIWAVEITEYSLLYIAFLGAAWLLKKEGHVRVDVVLNLLNPRNQTLVNIITSILGAMVCLVIAWYGAEITWDHFVRGVPSIQLLHTPRFLILMIIPIGSFLLFIQFLRRTYGYLGERQRAKVVQGSQKLNR